MKNRLGSCKSSQRNSKTMRKSALLERRGGKEVVLSTGAAAAGNSKSNTSEYFDYVSEVLATNHSADAGGAGEETDNPRRGEYNTNNGRAHNKYQQYKRKFTVYSNKERSSGMLNPGANGVCYQGLDSLSHVLDQDRPTATPATRPRAPTSTSKGHKQEEIPVDTLLKFAPCCDAHQLPCKVLTVKKAGANKGRLFYKCSVYPMEQCCNYFMWCEVRRRLLYTRLQSRFICNYRVFM